MHFYSLIEQDMITKIFGTIDEISDEAVIIETGGIYYAVYMPPVHLEHIARSYQKGDSILVYTIYYIEAGVGVGNLEPRLLGFLNPSDREFFEIFTTVKGIGARKALQAIMIPIPEICSAIESRNTAVLKRLKGIGGRMSDKIIAELRGRVGKFAAKEEISPEVPLSSRVEDFVQETLEILIGRLGYRRIEAENLIHKALTNEPAINSSEELIQAIFKHTVPITK